MSGGSSSSLSQPTPSPALLASKPLFVSLYGGAGRCAEEASKIGCNGLIFDLAHHDSNNICRPKVQKDIESLVVERDVEALGIDLLCSSWTLARRAPVWSKMPSPLRDSEKYLFGLPDLNEADNKRVRVGNQMYRHAIKLINLCIEHGVCGYLENPLSSRLWRTPGIQKLLKSNKGWWTTCHMCQYGVQWRKATRFFFWGVPKDSIVLKTCTMHFGRCSATNKRHLDLSGKHGSRFWTAVAQVYPRELAKDLIIQLLEVIRKKKRTSLPDPPEVHKMGLGC